LTLPTLHLLGIFHTVADDRFSHCAFTGKARRFPKMMRALGWRVIEYGNAGSEAEPDVFVEILNAEEFDQHFPHEDPSGFFGDKAVVGSPGHGVFEARLLMELRARLKPGDIVCHPFGHAHEEVARQLPDYDHVEIGIGYPQLLANSWRIFESNAWMHWHLGKAQASPRNYDFVIPNYFDLEDWEEGNGAGCYLAFLGRVCDIKGMSVVRAIADVANYPIKVAGQGDSAPWLHPKIEFVGPLTGLDRADFLRGATALLMPSLFVEPFGGSGVEAMLCGTPLLAPPYGAFTETIIPGMTGFHCRTLPEWLEGIRQAQFIDRHRVRELTASRYSLETCGLLYDRAFRQIHGVRVGKGYDWYGPRLFGPLDLFEPVDFTAELPPAPESEEEKAEIDFDRIELEEAPFAERLAKWIARLNPEMVLDLGCGPGTYVRALHKEGVTAVGIDIDERTPEGQGFMRMPVQECRNWPGEDAEPLVLCLEVAEHVPPEDETEFMDGVANTVADGGLLIWTAAAPGQGGEGHVNCQPRQHWQRLLQARGLIRVREVEENLLAYAKAGYHMGWFTQNLMVFLRPAGLIGQGLGEVLDL
jgi:glycosyltransferase involved in cell wall biosynthesis